MLTFFCLSLLLILIFSEVVVHFKYTMNIIILHVCIFLHMNHLLHYQLNPHMTSIAFRQFSFNSPCDNQCQPLIFEYEGQRGSPVSKHCVGVFKCDLHLQTSLMNSSDIELPFYRQQQILQYREKICVFLRKLRKPKKKQTISIQSSRKKSGYKAKSVRCTFASN